MGLQVDQAISKIEAAHPLGVRGFPARKKGCQIKLNVR